MQEVWRKCSTCKKDIYLNGIYYVCSISTCRAKATNYVFCSVPCWDTHVPVERHRGEDVAAIEKRAPRFLEAVSEKANEESRPVQRTIVSSSSTANEEEILVVVSKVKKYIADKSQMNVSASTMDVLSARIRRICDRAIEEARRQGRKTVMDRDVP